MSGTYPKATGDDLPAVDWNIVAAQADSALKPGGNLAGLANVATARSNLGLHAVASSGSYDDLAGRLLDTSDASAGVLELIDSGMEIGVQISAAGIAMGNSLLGSDDIATLPVVLASAATLAGTEFAETDGAGGVDITDPGMEVAESIAADGVRRIGDLSFTQATGTPGIDIADPGMESPLAVDAEGMAVAAVTFSMSDAPAGLAFIDPGMEVAAQINANGSAEGFGGTGTDTHAATEVTQRNAENLAAAAGMATNAVTNIARPVRALNHFISYGQSLSIGSEGTPVLSGTAKYDNLMFGDRVRPTTNNSATATWDRVGAAAFNPLVATGDTETPIIGALNTFRRMWLASRGVASDAAIRFVASSAGIGGRNIAELSLGASPDIFQRVISVMDQANTQAAVESKTYGVTAMLWMQGESNQTTLAPAYLSALRTLYADFKAAAISETGQADPPAMFLYQNTQTYASDTVDMGVQMAQLTAALNDDGIYMIGPTYPVPDSNNLHLPANSYRWLGAQFGKVMHRVLTLGHRWKPLHIRRATRRGREVLVDYHVPYPPLVLQDPWLQDGWFIGETVTGGTNTQFAVPDSGFSVRGTGGEEQDIISVALASDTQIRITLATQPSSALALVLRYANGKNAQFGHGCVRDSDPALGDEVWLDGQPGQTDADTNATLSGARYPLHNWAVAQQIDIEVLS